MQEEVETEAVKETDQIFVGTGEVSEAGEDHIGVFHLAKDFRATRLRGSTIQFNSCHVHYIQPKALNYFFTFLSDVNRMLASLLFYSSS